MHGGNQSIYLHHSGPLLENGLDRPENRYGRYLVFLVFSSISISTVGVDGARVLLLKIFFSCSLGGGGGRYFSVPRCSQLISHEGIRPLEVPQWHPPKGHPQKIGLNFLELPGDLLEIYQSLLELERAQGATRLGATGLRASERKSASERGTSENLSKISENLSKTSQNL